MISFIIIHSIFLSTTIIFHSIILSTTIGNIYYITSLQPLAQLLQLEELDISSSHGMIEFPDLRHCPLKTLKLKHVETDLLQRVPSTIQKLAPGAAIFSPDDLPNVTEFKMGSYITRHDWSFLTNFTRLRSLDMKDANIGNLSFLSTLPLEMLDLHFCDGVTHLPTSQTLKKLIIGSHNLRHHIDFTPVHRAPLQELTYKCRDSIDTLDFLLPWKTTLKKLKLSTSCPDPSAITQLQTLEVLDFFHYCNSGQEHELGFNMLHRLRKLICRGVTILSIPPSLREIDGECNPKVLAQAPHLKIINYWEHLDLPDLASLEEIALYPDGGVTHIPNLSTTLRSLEIDAAQLTTIEPFAILHQLRVLIMENLQQVQTLDPLKHLSLLQQLTLGKVHQANDIDFASHLTDLIYLRIEEFIKLQSLHPLSNCRRLRHLNVNHYHNIYPWSITPTDNQLQDLTGIEHCRKLQKLHINNTNIQNLKPVAAMCLLEEIEFENTRVMSLEPLKYLTRLSRISGRHCRRIMTIKHLQNLPNLFDISFDGCPQLNVKAAYRALGMDEYGNGRD